MANELGPSVIEIVKPAMRSLLRERSVYCHSRSVVWSGLPATDWLL